MALKWGICGSGEICKAFARTLQALPSGEHEVVAVAARSDENAKQFASKYGISRAYASYQALANDTDVDVIYIGVINSEHLNACELMLKNGKHVLCEKPFALTHGQAKRMLNLAKEKNLFCMEAIGGRFSPAYMKIREMISSGRIGDVKVVLGNFGKPMLHMERIAKNELGGGAILDLGVYLVQFALMAYGGKAPISVTAKGFLTESGVDDTSTMTLQFPDNGMASLTCSASTRLDGEAYVFGTKGKIKVPSVLSRPTKLQVSDADGKTEILDFPIPPEASNEPEAFLRYEADVVKECIRAGKLESSLLSHADSLHIASIMDKARHDLGYQLEYERANLVMPCQ